ncbi:MAG: aminotransferase class I/II-fold pyridoxal phosphate-dependent enzyme [Treponemataceae bacterium]|nr:aminotransferase class I/II-fold pyridoxal phosphate-dependent enzyme [Treponemataceae bacterium]
MHGGNIYSTKIKYDFSVNVNPYRLPLKAAFSFFRSYASLKNYPDINSAELSQAVSEKYSIPEKNIIMGNGASDIIFATVRALAPKKALLLSPCFSGYIHALNSLGTEIIYFPLKAAENFSLSAERFSELKKFIKNEKPDMFFLCNPNNPNGILYSRDFITELCDLCKTLGIFILLDECFIELSGKAKDYSLCSTFHSYDNLIIINALTKTYAVPGLRLGFGICSSEKILSGIKHQMPEWNVSIPAQKVGKVLLQDVRYITSSVKKIKKERKFLSDGISKLGLKVYPSDSNFILFYTEKQADLKTELIKQQILIRDCSDYENLKNGFYRVAVKSHGENKILLRKIKKALG